MDHDEDDLDVDYEDDYLKYFYRNDFKGELPGVDLESDGYPSYNDLTDDQLKVVEMAYEDEQERQEMIWNPEYYYGTSR